MSQSWTGPSPLRYTEPYGRTRDDTQRARDSYHRRGGHCDTETDLMRQPTGGWRGDGGVYRYKVGSRVTPTLVMVNVELAFTPIVNMRLLAPR